MSADGNPQLENGYLKIADQIIDELIKIQLPGYEWRCLFFIIRRTYGWNKKTAEIPINDFVLATGILKPNISRALKALKYKKIIIVIKNDNYKYLTYSFNKHFNEWKQDKVIKNDNPYLVIKNDNKELSKMITKRSKNDNKTTIVPILVKNIIKDNINTSDKSKIKIFDAYDISYLLSETLLNQIKRNLPNNISIQDKYRKKTLQLWSAEIDKMIRIDNRNPCHIWNIIIWCHYDDFWFKNILSGSKLRKQYDTLSAAIISEDKKNRNKSQRTKLFNAGERWKEKYTKTDI